MKVSELIDELRTYQLQHGNQEVVDSYDDPIGSPEECEGVCVLADKA